VVFSANDLNARTTLLYLFQGRSKALFPPSLSSDLEILAETDMIRTTTSKKEPEIRQRELAKALSPYLLKAISEAAADLVATSFGCQFVTEVLFGAQGDKSAALTAVAETAAGDPAYTRPSVEEGREIAAIEDLQSPSHLASTPHGGKMLKALIAGGRFDNKARSIVPVEPALDFADILYPYIKDYIMEWATGSSSFVVLALLEANSFSHRDEVLKVLEDGKKALKKAAKEETSEQKLRREASEADAAEAEPAAKPGNKAKKSKPIKEREVGNKGAALLLEKLG